MKLEIVRPNSNPYHRLGIIYVTKMEALCLIRSLTNQLVANDPNVGRLESHCSGDADECTIFVVDEQA